MRQVSKTGIKKQRNATVRKETLSELSGSEFPFLSFSIPQFLNFSRGGSPETTDRLVNWPHERRNAPVHDGLPGFADKHLIEWLQAYVAALILLHEDGR